MMLVPAIPVHSAASRRCLALEGTRRNRKQWAATATPQQIRCGLGVPSPSLHKASVLYEREIRSRGTPGQYSRGQSCSSSVAAASSSSRASDSSQSATTTTSSSPSTSTSIVLGVSLVVSTGVVNRLLYKASADACGPRLALFLALLQASAPAIVYSLILLLRVRAGMTSREELDAPPTWPLLAVGAGEAGSSVLGFLVASRLPGAALPMLAQSMLVWQMGFESIFLKRKQTRGKLVGAAMVVAGVCLAAWPASSSGGGGAGAGAETAARAAAIPLGAALTYVFAQSFPAAAALAKERIFARAAEKLNSVLGEEGSGSGDGDGAAAAAAGAAAPETTAASTAAAAAAAPAARPAPPPPPPRKQRARQRKQLDTFVVSARASVAQAAVVAALLPLSALLGPARLSPRDLPRYLLDGLRAVAGLASSDGLSAPIPGFPALPLAYVAANVLFNVALLRLLRAAGAFVYSAGAALLVPAAIVAFSVRWPFLPPVASAASMGPHFALGAAVLVAGLAVVVATSTGARGGGGKAGEEKAAGSAAAAAAAADSEDDEQKLLLSPPLLGDVGLEAA